MRLSTKIEKARSRIYSTTLAELTLRCKHNRPVSNKAFDLFCIKKRYDLQYYFYKKSQHTA